VRIIQLGMISKLQVHRVWVPRGACRFRFTICFAL